MTPDKKRLVILGASGHGKVVAEIAEQAGYEEICFVDAQAELLANLKWPVVGKSFNDIKGAFTAFVAIGNNKTRAAQVRDLVNAGIPLARLIHRAAVVSSYAIVAPGSAVMANAVVNPAAQLGTGVIANTGCTIDHDCAIGEYSHISPGAHLAGNVIVGQRSWIGIGACIREGIVIGDDVTVGAGSVVVSPIASGSTVVGNPARPMGAIS